MIRLGIIIFIQLSSLIPHVVTGLYLYLYISSIISIYFHNITLLVHGRVLLRNFFSITYLEFGKLTYFKRHVTPTQVKYIILTSLLILMPFMPSLRHFQYPKRKGERWRLVLRDPRPRHLVIPHINPRIFYVTEDFEAAGKIDATYLRLLYPTWHKITVQSLENSF